MHDINKFVGNRIRTARILAGKAQQELAKEIGVSFQQLQRYERGFNRVSAPMLWLLARALDVRIDYFFDGYSLEEKPISWLPESNESLSPEQDIKLTRLIGSFRRLETSQKEAVLALVRSISAEPLED